MAEQFEDTLRVGVERDAGPKQRKKVLLRLATLRGDPQMLVAAIEQLRGAVQFADVSKVVTPLTAIEAALGRALLAEYASGGQPLLLDLAATAFRRAIRSAAKAKSLVTRAAFQHELGMTLWAMAERAADGPGLDGAAEMLEVSIASFNALDQGTRAKEVHHDLARLRATQKSDSAAKIASLVP